MSLLFANPGRERERAIAQKRRIHSALHAQLRADVEALKFAASQPSVRDWLAGIGLMLIFAEIVIMWGVFQ